MGGRFPTSAGAQFVEIHPGPHCFDNGQGGHLTWLRLANKIVLLTQRSRRERETMPTYEYHCKECNKKFDLMMTISQHEKAKVVCPKCNSKKVEQKAAAFFAVSAKKS